MAVMLANKGSGSPGAHFNPLRKKNESLESQGSLPAEETLS